MRRLSQSPGMKMRYGWLVLGLLTFCGGILEAKTENGLSLIAQKVTLDAEKDRGALIGWDKVKRALGLKLEIRNSSFNDFPEGKINYVVIVKKWGFDDKFERHRGEETLPAMARGQSLSKVIGKVALDGYETGGNRRQFMDTIEAYQVIVTHAGKQTLELTSSNNFKTLNEMAKDARY